MLEDNVHSTADVFCPLTQDYRDYLRELEDCDDEEQDEFLKMCAIFLHMSDDFIFFVSSYRANDAIGVLKGYDAFVPVWVALGQNKYVACFHDQINELLVKNKYRRYVESLLNRMVRTQPGKGAVAQDKYLELMNRLFAMFPKVRTLKGMGRLGDILGLTQKSKRFAQKFYVKTDADDERKVTKTGTKAKQKPEKMAIYELFRILLHGRPKKRELSNSVVRDVVNSKQVKVQLKNKKTTRSDERNGGELGKQTPQRDQSHLVRGNKQFSRRTVHVEIRFDSEQGIGHE